MKKLIHVTLILGVSFLIFGCWDSEPALPQYTPKALDAQAKGITIVQSTPYNCKVLGEVEGKDAVGRTRGAVEETLRESAINDLKNTAAETAGQDKRIMLKISKEQVRCQVRFKDGSRAMDCTNGVPENALDSELLSYRIQADVYECGTK